MLKLKEFRIRNPLLNPASIWGSGHTHHSDPHGQGWRAKEIKGGQAILVGMKQTVGCFSAVLVKGRINEGSYLDVALYADETPEYVAKKFEKGAAVDAEYIRIPMVSGWGLLAREELKERM